MAIINFSIPTTLEKRLSTVMEQKGFTTKAEFFRFAAIYFMDVINKPTVSEDDRFQILTTSVKKEVQHRYGSKKLPSVTEQLADL